jgi:hypothetical protein
MMGHADAGAVYTGLTIKNFWPEAFPRGECDALPPRRCESLLQRLQGIEIAGLRALCPRNSYARDDPLLSMHRPPCQKSVARIELRKESGKGMESTVPCLKR